MSARPFFSVVVPTRGRPVQLARCLDALARLDYPRDRFEVVVAVDGADATEAPVATPPGLSLTVVHQQQASGPARARNAGAAAARGRYLAFTDDDCAPETDWLRRLEARLEEAPDALVGGLTTLGFEPSIYARASQLVVDALYAYYGGNEYSEGFFTTNNLAVSAARWHDIGGFDGSFPFAAGEDHEFCDRWRNHGWRLVYAPEAVVRHSHDLRLRTFLIQHFTYGRGTVHLHRARRARGLDRPRFAPGLYWLLFVRLPLRHRVRYALALPPLAFATQAAYAVGFLHERRRSRISRKRESPATAGLS